VLRYRLAPFIPGPPLEGPRRVTSGRWWPVSRSRYIAKTVKQIAAEALTAHDVVGFCSPNYREDVFSETEHSPGRIGL
jgi:hypothetical protein